MASLYNVIRHCGKVMLVTVVLVYTVFVFAYYIYSPSALHVVQTETSNVPTFNSIAAYTLNCSDIKDIHLIRKLGIGTSRRAYLGVYQGKHVVVKTAIKNISYDCIAAFEEYRDKPLKEMVEVITYCSSKDIRHMLLEIIYHAVLNFPPFIKNLGFCMNATDIGREAPKSIYSAMGREVVSVYEYGDQVSPEALRRLSAALKLYYVKQFLQLPHTLNSTVIGPVAMIDFQTRHLLHVNGQLKIYDLGLYVNEEITCGPRNHTNPILKYLVYRPSFRQDECALGAQCVNGVCQNMHFLLNEFLISRNLIKYFISENLVNNNIATTNKSNVTYSTTPS